MSVLIKTKSMKQSSWLSFSWSRYSPSDMYYEGSYRVNKSLPLVLILSQMYQVLNLTLYFFYIHINIILPSTPKSSRKSLLQIFRLKCCVHSSSFSCLSHTPPILSYPILSYPWFAEDYKLWSSLLCNFEFH